jgi:hypothetical protein
MSALDRIAYFQRRRDAAPNQALARELAEKKDKRGIREIAMNLWNDNLEVQSDCLKVLYDVGGVTPRLIADYADDFLKLLRGKNNRLVWGAMTALAAIADLIGAELFEHWSDIRRAMETGSVITVDNGVSTLALVAASDEGRRRTIFPYLLQHLATCRPKDVPQHAESTLPAVEAGNRRAFVATLEKRIAVLRCDLSAAQATRVRRVIKQAEAS